jgi:cytochrome c oxidase subunit II
MIDFSKVLAFGFDRSWAFFLSNLSVSVSEKGFWSNFWENIQPPEDISTTGHLIEYLFNYTTVLNLIYFVLLCAGLFGFSLFYYYRRHPKPYFTYGNKKLHLWVTAGIGLSVFLSIDLNITRLSNDDMLNAFWKWPGKSEKVLHVEVMAQQWMWHFRYAGEDGEFNTVDDIVLPNHLVIPQDTKVLINMTSKDVIHSLYLPNFKLKVDAIPGRITRMWFEAKKTGDYEIACAEMCGIHHYLMKAKVTVHSEEGFSHWLKEANTIALATNDPKDPDSFWGWKWENE